MHRIVESHLTKFSESHGLQADEESVRFEKFAMYCVSANRFTTTFDLDDVTTGDNDDGIDGIAITIDEIAITSAEDAETAFRAARRNHDVEIIFIQAKRTEGFDLGEFLKFKEGILRFATHAPYASINPLLKECRQIFDTVIREVHKVRNGKPSLVGRYVSTGLYQSPPELEAALSQCKKQLDESSLFHECDIKFVDRNELVKLWTRIHSTVDASLPVFSHAALPNISGIDEAYLAVVRASDFVNNLLLTEDGSLRNQVFEENVRSFLGDDNLVNRSIAETLQSDTASRFPVLNNGITIVSPDVQLQGTTLHFKNYQIVNGCQTSNVLFDNRHLLKDIMVNIKVVETQQEDVFFDLVKATNSQTSVTEKQFFSLRPISKRIEQYFNACTDDEGRIYLERRERQYSSVEIANTRIFPMDDAVRCVAAMFCNRPDLAGRYAKQIYDELDDVIFREDAKEAAFYAACLTMYRFKLLVSNNTIPQNMKRFKWHILPIVRAAICGASQGRQPQQLNSKAADKQAAQIIEIMRRHGQRATNVFERAVKTCQPHAKLTRDSLKRQGVLNTLLDEIR